MTDAIANLNMPDESRIFLSLSPPRMLIVYELIFSGDAESFSAK